MRIKYILTSAFLLPAIILPGISSAQTTTDLQTQINVLLQKIAQLQTQLGTSATASLQACHTFNATLRIGASGAEVKSLQSSLTQDGETVPGTGIFGPLTALAVTKFQQKYAALILAPNGLTHGTGIVGTATRTKLNALYGCKADGQIPPPILVPTPAPSPAPVTPSAAAPAPSSGLTGTPLGGPNHIKNPTDNLGTINFSISTAGSIALNKIIITFTGNAVTPALLSSVALSGPNGVDVVDSGAATMTTSTNSATWTFGAGAAGFALSGGTKDSFTLEVDSTKATAAQGGVSQSLSVSVQNPNDILFTDGLDAAATVNIGIPSAIVPIVINSVSYPTGQ